MCPLCKKRAFYRSVSKLLSLIVASKYPYPGLIKTDPTSVASNFGQFWKGWFNQHSDSFDQIDYFHIAHNTPCLPPKILHNHCFQFLLGIAAREIEDWRQAYAFWSTRCIISGHRRHGEYQLCLTPNIWRAFVKMCVPMLKRICYH